MLNARNVGNIQRKAEAKQWLLRIQLKGVKFYHELENEDRFCFVIFIQVTLKKYYEQSER